MIVWTVTVLTATTEPIERTGATDARHSAASEALTTAVAAVHELAAADTFALPLVSVTIDHQLVAMLATGRDVDGHPELDATIDQLTRTLLGAEAPADIDGHTAGQ